MDNARILVVTLGGTIESFYDPEISTPGDVPLEDSAEKTIIPEAMRKLGINGDCDFLKLRMRDSKYSNGAEYHELLRHAIKGGYDRILIVEGTDRLPEFAQTLQALINAQGGANGADRKSFVLTGALEPLRNAKKEWREADAHNPRHDGWVNLRRAKHHLERGMPFGVFVWADQKLWPAGRVEKWREVGPDNVVVASGFKAVKHPDTTPPPPIGERGR